MQRQAPVYILNGESLCIFGSQTESLVISEMWKKDLPHSSFKIWKKVDADWIFKTWNRGGRFWCDLVGGKRYNQIQPD